MHQNRQNLLVNCHIERFLTVFLVTALLNILCIFHAFFMRQREIIKRPKISQLQAIGAPSGQTRTRDAASTCCEVFGAKGCCLRVLRRWQRRRHSLWISQVVFDKFIKSYIKARKSENWETKRRIFNNS